MKNYKNDIEIFIKKYSQSIIMGDAAVFIGSGLSREAGYLGWDELLKDKAKEINLDVEKENGDLISLAQYYINSRQRTQINEAISSFFALKNNINPTKTHQLLSALPIQSYWTTNYDRLLEKNFENNDISYRAYFSDENLSVSKNNAEVILHKMHGDVENPNSAVIAKSDYEKYNETHEMMLAKFKGEMCSKTFLFLGYSFSDPNIHHILSRIRKVYDKNAKQHYCIMQRVQKKNNGKMTEDYEYKVSKQEHQIQDFKNYGINVLLVDSFKEIASILEEIRRRVFMKNVLICGAYEDDTENKDKIAQFTTALSSWLVERGCHIYCGFGKNLGGHIVKGAFDGCVLSGEKSFSEYLSLFPFPYNVNLSEKSRNLLYKELRKNMITNTRITIVISGEKTNKSGDITASQGVLQEVEISKKQQNLIIPIAVSGGAAKLVWEQMLKESKQEIKDEEFSKLNLSWGNYTDILGTVQNIISRFIS